MHKYINSTGQIPQNTQFIVFLDDSFSCMGDNYGPPDPRKKTKGFPVIHYWGEFCCF